MGNEVWAGEDDTDGERVRVHVRRREGVWSERG